MSNILQKQFKLVCQKSGNRCAWRDCKKLLTMNSGPLLTDLINVGQIAHIKGEREGAARYDPEMTDQERNNEKNLLLLCYDHHKLIDDKPDLYPVEFLTNLKYEHEKWIVDSTRKTSTEITFNELAVIIPFIITNTPNYTNNLQVLPPDQKIRRNNLSSVVKDFILIGSLKFDLVKSYIKQNPDTQFGERLKTRIRNIYLDLKQNQGLEGDELFYILWNSLNNEQMDYKIQTASLTVLVYFFNTCDVFENDIAE